MLCYLPEKLYKVIINDESAKDMYDAILVIINRERKSYTNLTDGLKMENEEYIKKNDMLSNARDNLNNLIMTKFSEYSLPFLIQSGKYNKTELISLFKSMTEESMTDIKAICLSEIVDNSYDDNSFIEYMEEYKSMYESLSDKELKSLSVFTHMKYMKASIYLLGNGYCSKYNEFMKTITDVNSIYKKALKYANGNEVITHAYIECICDFLNLISDKDGIKKFAISFRNTIQSLEATGFQYSDYSFGVANFLYILSKIQLNEKDYSGFVNTTEELVKYINNSLKDIQTLISGLTFYDKTNITMYFSLIRWIIRLNMNVNVIKNNNLCILSNLQIIDYNTAISDMEIINKDTNGEKVMVCSNAFSKFIDKWFSARNPAYVDIKKL